MSAEDKYREQTRKCIDCGAEFNWSASEQERFHGLRLTDPPQRCEDCRQPRKVRGRAGRSDGLGSGSE